jgi:isoaspartyl peptidase/L-asparaginase-like protein (Ntn-hydrolase superfamily)
MMKIMPLSNVLHAYFSLQTAFQRAIHEHEKKTGRPAAVIVVLDLQGKSLQLKNSKFLFRSEFDRIY